MNLKTTAALICIALAGCDARLTVESDSGKPVEVKIGSQDGTKTTMYISEICYDGVVYLVTPQGGMAPKVNKDDDGAMMGISKSPFVKCR
jgi:hypothetical protein